MAKRGRPRKDDPRHLARKAEKAEHEALMARLASGNNISGYPPGVHKTDTGQYQARISLEGKRINLGSFPTPEQRRRDVQCGEDGRVYLQGQPEKE